MNLSCTPSDAFEVRANNIKLKEYPKKLTAIGIYCWNKYPTNPKIIDKQNPTKLDPVSPINVLAGLKLYGKNPHKEPHSAVIKIIDINAEPLSENTIKREMQEIIAIPVDNPSSPSIRFIAFVNPTIQIIVINIYTHWGNCSLNNSILSILIPQKTTIVAATICANNLKIAFAPYTSS